MSTKGIIWIGVAGLFTGWFLLILLNTVAGLILGD